MKGLHMLRALLAVALALSISAQAQIVNRPVAANSIANPGTSTPAVCAVGMLYFKSNSTAGQNLHLCTAANTWTQLSGGNLSNPVTPGQGGSGVANSKNLTWSNSLTFAGTDSTTMTFPTTSATIARTDAGNTFTGNQVISAGDLSLSAGNKLKFSATSYMTPENNTTGAETAAAGTVRLRGGTGVVIENNSTGGAQLRSTQTTAPTCSTNCGTSPSVSGTDTAGIVTMGSSGSPASGWVVTFNSTWAAAPSCIVQSALATMVVGKMPIAVVVTTTTMTVTNNGTAPSTSDKYQYHCIGVS
jgi:hypothetical protein